MRQLYYKGRPFRARTQKGRASGKGGGLQRCRYKRQPRRASCAPGVLFFLFYPRCIANIESGSHFTRTERAFCRGFINGGATKASRRKASASLSPRGAANIEICARPHAKSRSSEIILRTSFAVAADNSAASCPYVTAAIFIAPFDEQSVVVCDYSGGGRRVQFKFDINI